MPWTNWGECSKECGGGEKFRTREKIPEQYGGEPCIGENEESQPCNTHNCPSELETNNLGNSGRTRRTWSARHFVVVVGYLTHYCK